MTEGMICKALSGFYYVDTAEGMVECRARGRFRLEKVTPLVGDRVLVQPDGEGRGTVAEILPRKNFFERPTVANLDRIVMVISEAIPAADTYLVDRLAAIAELRSCECVICINKIDLARGDELYAVYSGAGFPTLRVSAETGEGIEALRNEIAGRVCAFTGNSGVGKSSILNALEPEFKIDTGAVSERLGRGRHTTRHVELFRLSCGALVADTPGFSSFDVEEAEIAGGKQLQYAFREFAPYLGQCQYDDCAHVKEPGCAVLAAVAAGEIAPSRHESYVKLYRQAKQIKDWELKKNPAKR